jgi:hypothetical protein
LIDDDVDLPGNSIRRLKRVWRGWFAVLLVLIAGVTVVAGFFVTPSLGFSSFGWGQGNGLLLGELDAAKQPSELCSNRNPVGTGLRGEYFPKANFAGTPLLSRVDTTVDFTRHLDWPSSLENSKPHSARWSGWIRPAFTGMYTFHVFVPGARIVISNQVVQSGTPAASHQIKLESGRYYPVVMEVPDLDVPGFDGVIQFEWTSPHGVRFLVPRALLYLPSDQATISTAQQDMVTTRQRGLTQAANRYLGGEGGD